MENQIANLQTEYNLSSPKPVNLELPGDKLLSLNEESSQLFEQTMSSSGVIAVNEDGVILSFNKKASEIFGFSAEEAIGKNIGDLILLEYPDKLDSCIINFLRLNKEIQFLDRLIEVSERSEKGSIVPLKFAVGKTHLDDRLLITVTVQHLDKEKLQTKNERRLIKILTEVDQFLARKQAEIGEYKDLLQKEIDKSKQLVNKVRLSQAMSSFDARFIKAGKLAEQIAHDFNNLLVPLKAFPALLKDKLPPGSECIEYCETMGKIAHRLTQMNDQLLALMNQNRQDNVIFDVNMTLSEAINLVSDYFKGDFKIESQVPKEKFPISGRPEQLYRVFFNLLLNARDAVGKANGCVSVKSEKVATNTENTLKNRVVNSEYIKISISDNGPGIAKADLNKIFDPFYTTKNRTKYKSSGLGLCIVNDIVRDHSGFIEVDSKIGEGTVVSVHLPIKAGAIGHG